MKPETMRRIWLSLAIIVVLTSIAACRTIPVEKREPMRAEINSRGNEIIERLVVEQPDLQKKIDASAGYFTGRLSALKAPVVGGSTGIGVLYDQEQAMRTYLNVKRYDLGLGLGTGTYRVLAVFDNREALEKFRLGTWTGSIGAETARAEKISAAATLADEGMSLYLLPESGAAFVATARLVSLSVNEDLTDSGVSDVNIPNIGFDKAERQGDDAPRKWNRALPFLAQNVIDMGYDLPLPYGIGMSFVHVNQENLLADLEVGLNGGAKEPFPFVSFDNANSISSSAQVKLDAWLFPFMNVFATVGKLEGKAPLDVNLDGNLMLDQLGITCGTPPPPLNPLCNVLQDKIITLPIEADFTGTTYGVGTVLATGYKNWFVTVPVNFTYADMDKTNTDGISTTVTPRVGRNFNLDKAGNVALYGGGNYLNNELTITGTVFMPGTNLKIDYTMKQKNKDNWNAVMGGNWSINKRISFSAEYNGFVGSREATICSFNWRF